MRTQALEALEWGKVVARLAAHAASGPGRELCAALAPGTDTDAVRVRLEENRDGRRMLAEDGPLALSGLKEIAPHVAKAIRTSPVPVLRSGIGVRESGFDLQKAPAG